jgi:hypothetical protein
MVSRRLAVRFLLSNGQNDYSDSKYLTKERRNDHYSKMKKGADKLLSCTGW